MCRARHGHKHFVKKIFIYNYYTWVRHDNGRIRNRAMMYYVVVLRNEIGQLLDGNILRKKGEGMSNHYLVEEKL